VLHGTEEIYGEEAEAGAAYYLAFKHAGGSLLIEPGRRRRPYVLGYAPKHVFFSPTGRHAAILISTTRSAFEGTRSSWMTNGIALPDYL
jgi:hypothetical protein